MKCPYCGFGQDRVVDSRESKEADSIRRRRECEKCCNRRFTTYERIDEIPYMVVKKDGRRERFDRQKILSGLLHACEKRPVPSSQTGKDRGRRGDASRRRSRSASAPPARSAS
jgi:transcriptional repressor NrdR